VCCKRILGDATPLAIPFRTKCDLANASGVSNARRPRIRFPFEAKSDARTRTHSESFAKYL
jgi:hypothetical protein